MDVKNLFNLILGLTFALSLTFTSQMVQAQSEDEIVEEVDVTAQDEKPIEDNEMQTEILKEDEIISGADSEVAKPEEKSQQAKKMSKSEMRKEKLAKAKERLAKAKEKVAKKKAAKKEKAAKNAAKKDKHPRHKSRHVKDKKS